MPRRAMVIFWASVAAAVFLLGGGVGSVRALAAGGGVVAAGTLLLSAVGLAVALLVAGRIALVAGRMRRVERRALAMGAATSWSSTTRSRSGGRGTTAPDASERFEHHEPQDEDQARDSDP